MPSTPALYTGLSGLLSNQQRLNVIGNNIANVNTTAFKSTRMMFEAMFSRTQSLGTGPSNRVGGINPMQVGNGSTVAGTQRNFMNGALTAQKFRAASPRVKRTEPGAGSAKGLCGTNLQQWRRRHRRFFFYNY